MQTTPELQKLQNFINESNKIVFFGGAGVSTESGVPDFRSKDGLYNQHDIQFEKYQPEYLLSHSCLRDNPKVFFEYYRQKMDARHVKPNMAHQFLVKLEEAGKLSPILTQNIDGLHQKAGSKNVCELHGTTLRNYCSYCNKEYPEDYIFDSEDLIPTCACGGVIRPFVTLYEEALPEGAYDFAIDEIRNADMLIIAGKRLMENGETKKAHSQFKIAQKVIDAFAEDFVEGRWFCATVYEHASEQRKEIGALLAER